ncbi:MAG: hypothetical protein AAGL98_06490 [Planctomycetota bacterium]
MLKDLQVESRGCPGLGAGALLGKIIDVKDQPIGLPRRDRSDKMMIYPTRGMIAGLED